MFLLKKCKGKVKEEIFLYGNYYTDRRLDMIKSETLYSPQSYLELVTGRTYTLNDSDNDIEAVEKILEELGYCLWSHALTEIEHIIEEDLPVVLVDCLVWNENSNEYEHILRWFEVDE